MAFQEYTLSSLRDDLKLEFGLEGTDQDGTVDRRINDAIKHIIRAKNGTWPWLLKDLVINVPATITGTMDVTNGSPTALNASPAPTDPSASNDRQIIDIDATSADLTSGFLITDVTGTTVTMDANYLGETEVGANYTLVTGYYRLPSDFGRMRSLYDNSNALNRVSPVTIDELEELRRQRALAVGIQLVYTVQKDPLPESHDAWNDNFYLVVYPYQGSQMTLRGKYFADHQDLVADADVPLVPRNNRQVIFEVAAWRLAMTFKESSQILAYKAIADESMKSMLREYDLSVDKAEQRSIWYNPIGPVMPPPNWPSFRA